MWLLNMSGKQGHLVEDLWQQQHITITISKNNIHQKKFLQVGEGKFNALKCNFITKIQYFNASNV